MPKGRILFKKITTNISSIQVLFMRKSDVFSGQQKKVQRIIFIKRYEELPLLDNRLEAMKTAISWNIPVCRPSKV
jgi:hypothetical protein